MINSIKNTQEDNIEEFSSTTEIILAFDDLPIVARLQFVANIISTRTRNEDDTIGDRNLHIAYELLNGVIRELSPPHQSQNLRTLEA